MKRQLIMGLVMLGLASHAMATENYSRRSAEEMAAVFGITQQKATQILSEADSWAENMQPKKKRECKKLVDALITERHKVNEFLDKKELARVKQHFTELKHYREVIRNKHCLPTSVLDLAQDKVDALDEKLRTH